MEVFKAPRVVVWGFIGAGAAVTTFALLRSVHNYHKRCEMLRGENDSLRLDTNKAVKGWVKAEGREAALKQRLETTEATLKSATAEKEVQLEHLEERLLTRISKLENKNLHLERDLHINLQTLKELGIRI